MIGRRRSYKNTPAEQFQAEMEAQDPGAVVVEFAKNLTAMRLSVQGHTLIALTSPAQCRDIAQVLIEAAANWEELLKQKEAQG